MKVRAPENVVIRGEDSGEKTPRSKDPPALVERGARGNHMLEDVIHRDQVKRVRGERKRFASAAHKRDVLGPHAASELCGIRNLVLLDFHADDRASAIALEPHCAAAEPTSEIQYVATAEQLVGRESEPVMKRPGGFKLELLLGRPGESLKIVARGGKCSKTARSSGSDHMRRPRRRVDTGVADRATRRDRPPNLDLLVEATRPDSEQHREHQHRRRLEQDGESQRHDKKRDGSGEDAGVEDPECRVAPKRDQEVDDCDGQEQNRSLTDDAILRQHGQKAVVYGQSGLLAVEREQALFLLHDWSLPDADADYW